MRRSTRSAVRFATEIAKQKQWTPDAVRARTRKLTEFTIKFLDLDVAGQ